MSARGSTSFFRGVASAIAVAAGATLLAACSGGDSPPDGQSSPTTPSEPPTASATEPTAVASLTGEVVAQRVGVPRQLVPLDADRSLVVDQHGLVHVLRADTGLAPEPFLDVRRDVLPPNADRPETGLAGLALAPDFDTSRVAYTFHSRPPGPDEKADVERVDVLTEWRATPDGSRIDPASARELLAVPLDFSDHVGGLAIDEQGMLYAGFGSPVTGSTAQDPSGWSGTIIRIDPSRGTPYAVPDDNPFASGGPGLPEVWSYGYRNPFRLVWDPELRLLVTEPMFTEKDQQVSIAEAGANSGYPVNAEGEEDSCYTDDGPAARCRDFTLPVFEYGSDVGDIVSGALPYRGPVEALRGRVVVSDWEGTLLAAQPGPTPWSADPVDVTWPGGSPAGFLWGLGADGSGVLHALVADRSFGRDGQVVRLTE